MQQAQQNYNRLAVLALTLFAMGLPGDGLCAASIAAPAGSKPVPCDPRLNQPDYIDGVDVPGNPVAGANVPATSNPLPSEILVPLNRGRDGPIVALDGHALEPLLNPPACTLRPR